MSYIMSFSAWGGLISVVLSLISVIYLFRKKTIFLKGLISLFVGISAIIILNYTESECRSYWRPYWDSGYQHWNVTEEQAKNYREGWRSGEIDSDSLNKLHQLFEIDQATKIGNQIWKINNLNVDRFRNGDIIPEAKSKDEWIRAGENRKNRDLK